MKRKTLTKLACLTLAALLGISTVPGSVRASEQGAVQGEKTTSEEASLTEEPEAQMEEGGGETISVISVDPGLTDLTEEERQEIEASLQESPFGVSREAAASFTTVADAALAVKSAMIDRRGSAEFILPSDLVSMESNAALLDFGERVCAEAWKYDPECKGWEGDALKWARAGLGVKAENQGNGNTKVTLSFAWHSTSDQEAELTAAVDQAMDKLALGGKSDYEKVKAIHDYVCDNVDYVNNEEIQEYPERYTAYSALVKGKAVCQGYAILFYRMCREAGLQVRIIGGLGNGGAHGWNIVYISDANTNTKSRAGGAWYNVDCTWDGQSTVTKYTYFLKADDFPGHKRYEEYNSPDYPKAAASYLTGKGWNLTPIYEVAGAHPLAPPLLTSDGGKLEPLDGGDTYRASQGSRDKNKIYVFIQSTCTYSTGLVNGLNEKIDQFGDTNIYLISAVAYASEDDISKFKAKISDPNSKLNFMYNGKALHDIWLNYVIESAGKPINGNTPIVIYVDKNNQIQFATFGALAVSDVRQNLDAYCVGVVSDKTAYTVSYEIGEGGVNSPANPADYIEGSIVRLYPATKDGYTFKGWYRDANHTLKIENIEQTMKENLTLYALWEENPKVIYEMNGGTNSPENPTSYLKGPNEITLKNPTREGHIFLGWYSDEAFTVKITQIVTTAETGDVTVYAKWGQGSAITYVLDGGTNDAGNPNGYTSGDAQVKLYAPTKADFTFAGWYLDADFTGEPITEIPSSMSGDITLYAKWTANASDPTGFPQVDLTIADGNILLGVTGTYMTETAEKILERLNAIRLEACTGGVIFNGKALTKNDYKPLKWSADLEAIARLRAAEATLRMYHTRPNGKDCDTAITTRQWLNGENLAWNGGGLMAGIEGWYAEKAKWNGDNYNNDTGHYVNLINPSYEYVGLSAFQVQGVTNYPLAIAQALSMNPDKMSELKSDREGLTVQDMEVAKDAVTAIAFPDAEIALSAGATSRPELNATVSFQNEEVKVPRTYTGPIHKGATYSSSDSAIATVAADGTITAVANGQVTITAAAAGKTATMTVKVAGGSDPVSTPVPDSSSSDSSASATETAAPTVSPAPAASPAPVPVPQAAVPVTIADGDWNGMLQLIAPEAAAGTYDISMQNTTVIPADVVSGIKGKDIVLNLDMGNGISWSVNGQDVTGSNLADINLSVQTNTAAIPAEMVNTVAPEGYRMQISLAHDGDFGFSAVLSLKVGAEQSGQRAKLYYYNVAENRLDPAGECIVAGDGTVQFTFAHASDYVIVVEKVVDTQKNQNTPNSPPTGESGNPLLPVALLLFTAGSAMSILRRAGNRKEKQGNKK